MAEWLSLYYRLAMNLKMFAAAVLLASCSKSKEPPEQRKDPPEQPKPHPETPSPAPATS